MNTKILPILVSLLLIPGLAMAQQGTVSGTVLDEETGDTLPGASIQIPAEGVGTATNPQGEFSFRVAPGEYELRVSFVGYQSQTRTVDVTAGSTTQLRVQLQPGGQELEEVVVTALGIESQERELGYATSQVQGADIEDAGESNLTNALAGEVSGLQVRQSSGQPGSSSRITIRGNNSYAAGGNSPLIVVDGMIVSNAEDGNPGRLTLFSGGTANRLTDIDPNSIKDVNVLKGASATALYGSRASNGAIVITTKDGEGTSGFNASFSSTVGYSQPILEGYQDEYLQGNDGAFQNGLPPGRGAYNELADPNSPNFDPGADPAFAQTSNSFGPHKDSVSQAVIDSIGQPQTFDPRESFYEDAARVENTVTLSGSGDFGNARVTLSDTRQDGIVPTTDYNRTNVSAKFSADLGESFSVQASSQYTQSEQNRMLEANGSNSYRWGLYFTPINFDITDTEFEDGTERKPITFANNPLWLTDRQNYGSNVKRYVGNFQASWDATDWLTIREDIGVDTYSDVRKETQNRGTAGEPTGFTAEQSINRTEVNSTFDATVQQGITEDFSVELIVGNNISWRNYGWDYIEGTGIGVQDFFSIGNFSSTDQSAFDEKQSLIAAFGKATFNYQDYLYLTLTGRNDWSSTLPEGERSYFYPSSTLSFIFTDALEGTFGDSPLSYGKVRVNVSQVGSDTDPYSLQTIYNQAGPEDGVRGDINFPFRGVNGFTLDGTRANPTLSPEITTEYEVGTELRFFSGRANLDVTYYNRSTEDQIFNVPVSATTGFTTQSRNAGEIVNRGWEVQAGGTPLEIGDFSWKLDANWSTNTTEVKSLAPGVENIFLFGFTSIQIRAEEGEDGYGVIYGSRYRRNGDISEENPVTIDGEQRTSPLPGFDDDAYLIGPDGTRLQSSTNGNIGNVQPDWSGGLTSTFSWKGLTLTQQWETNQGAEVLNFDKYYLQGAGTHVDTEDRGSEVTREGIQVTTGEANDVSYVKDQAWYEGADRFVFERYVEDASYIKLRQLSLGYRFSLPDDLSQRSGLNSVRLQLVGRNLVTFTDFSMGDPAGSLAGAGNGQGFYHGITPNTRSYQASLSLNF